jgi:hypothetical protein
MSEKNDTALSGEIALSKVKKIQGRVDENAAIINGIVDRLVSDYCAKLDEYMEFVRSIVSDTKNPPSDIELDDFTLNIPVLLYFTGEAQESLGIKEDIAKAIKMEIYNELYGLASGTVADKSAKAELMTQAEFITHTAYSRAYKKVKLRMEAANETLQSIKKVLSRRMTEYELSRIDSQRITSRGGKDNG